MLKYSFLLTFFILTFTLSPAPISAQTGHDAILVRANQPLKQSDIDRLIEFYEWAFETTFSTGQRAEYRRYTEAEYRNDANAARATIDDIIQTLPKILAADSETQRDTRTNFLAAFLSEARKNNDKASQFLIGIYENAAGSTTRARPDSYVGSSVNSSASSRLVGVWHRSSGSGNVDPTGKTKYKSYEGSELQFFADGTLAYTKTKDVLAVIQCKIQGGEKARGTYSVNGDLLTLNFGPTEAFETNGCDRSKSFRKTTPAAAATASFEIKTLESVFRPDAPEILCLNGATDDMCYEKKVSTNR